MDDVRTMTLAASDKLRAFAQLTPFSSTARARIASSAFVHRRAGAGAVVLVLSSPFFNRPSCRFADSGVATIPGVGSLMVASPPLLAGMVNTVWTTQRGVGMRRPKKGGWEGSVW